MAKKVWCVRHREGWCATATGKSFKEEQGTVKTKCRHYVIMPLGCEFRVPTCTEGCSGKVPKSRKTKANDKTQGQDHAQG